MTEAFNTQCLDKRRMVPTLELALDVVHFGRTVFFRKAQEARSESEKRGFERRVDAFRRAGLVLRRIDNDVVNEGLVLEGDDALYRHLQNLQERAEAVGNTREADNIGHTLRLLEEGEEELERKREVFSRQIHIVPQATATDPVSPEAGTATDVSEKELEQERKQVMEKLLSFKTSGLYMSVPDTFSDTRHAGYQSLNRTGSANAHLDWVLQHNITPLVNEMVTKGTPEGFGIEAFTRNIPARPEKKGLFGKVVEEAVPAREEAVPVSEFEYIDNTYADSQEPAYVLQYRFDTNQASRNNHIAYLDYSGREGNMLHVTILLPRSITQEFARFFQKTPEKSAREFMRELARSQAERIFSAANEVNFDQLWESGTEATRNTPISPPYQEVDSKRLPFAMYYDDSIVANDASSGAV
jgi:hypothetical protein